MNAARNETISLKAHLSPERDEIETKFRRIEIKFRHNLDKFRSNLDEI